MTGDTSLVERLREAYGFSLSSNGIVYADQDKPNGLCHEAAARIEALSQALRDVGCSLDTFLKLVGDKQTFSGMDFYRWTGPPSYEDVQAALKANNKAASVLGEPGEGGL